MERGGAGAGRMGGAGPEAGEWAGRGWSQWTGAGEGAGNTARRSFDPKFQMESGRVGRVAAGCGPGLSSS